MSQKYKVNQVTPGGVETWPAATDFDFIWTVRAV